MLKINPSKQMFAGLVAVAVILMLVFVFAFMNQSAKVKKLHAEVQEKQTKLSDSKIMAQRLDDVQNRYMEALSDLSVLERGVNPKAYVPTFLRQVEELGKGVNLRVVGVRPKAPEPKPQAPVAEDGKDKKTAPVEQPKPYDELILNFEMNGKYWDVVKFVDKIKSFPKIIAIQSVDISPVGSRSDVMGSPALSVKLNAVAFILKDKIPSLENKKEAQVIGSGERI